MLNDIKAAIRSINYEVFDDSGRIKRNLSEPYIQDIHDRLKPGMARWFMGGNRTDIRDRKDNWSILLYFRYNSDIAYEIYHQAIHIPSMYVDDI